VAEIVANPLPKPRVRQDLHHDPRYYGIRNHLLDFLVNRSKTYQLEEYRHEARRRRRH
jgi:nitrate/nitrite transport system ATP-binding protein